MPLEAKQFGADWVAQHGKRLRLLYALQEEAARQGDWQTFVQLSLEREQLLAPLWHASPSELSPDIVALVQELWQANQHLQRIVAEQQEALKTAIAHLYHQQKALQGYQPGTEAGTLRDCNG